MGVNAEFKNTGVYGIKQSDWNRLMNQSDSPYYHYSDSKSGLMDSLRNIVNISSKNCSWNLDFIGYKAHEKGIFGKGDYICCNNCNKGSINGTFKFTIAQIEIVKETANPSKPKSGLFSSDIISTKYVLWDLELITICSYCKKEEKAYNLLTDGRSWKFSAYSTYFSNI